MKKILVLSIAIGFYCKISAQDESDSSRVKPLSEIIIRAYEQNRKLKDVPAAVNYVGRSAIERFGFGSMVQAVNSTPGVRMEERSPGSFRFNIRGSSLRSPFGVRNVKVYYNDLPITDPGGHTYLNQLGYYNFNSIEVIKGPGSSLYGAGTGGVLLIESLDLNEKPGAMAEYAAGSYGMQNIYGSISTSSGKNTSRVGFQHQESEGYRDQSALKRNVHSWAGNFQLGEKKILKTTFLYGDLFYETPGALTLAEFKANPKAARPAGGGFPSAVNAKASIRQRTFITGASYRQQLTPSIENASVLYGMFTELRNPTIRNYGKSSEPHVGGRTDFKYRLNSNNKVLQIDAGGEWQEGFTSVSIHKNINGLPDSLQTYDEIHNRQSFIFSQASIDFKNWSIIAGGSLNWLRVSFQRFTPITTGKQTRQFNNQISPRLAIMKKLGSLNVYSSISRGFSPPTTAELLPTGGAINFGLNAEEGTNYDLGFKGSLKKLNIDINAFHFALKETIVQRRDSSGGDYFVNAGGTKQHGIETYVSYPVLTGNYSIQQCLLWLSHTWHDFHYKDFKQLNNDFTGNQLPGVSPHSISSGFDLLTRKGFQLHLTWYYGSKLPLNDANSEYAEAYNILGSKISYQWLLNQWRIKIMAGADNLLDQHYSLGNDINAFGGRYYNAAPGRNFYGALLIQWITKKAAQNRS
ncbi:MAG: TonB-dependent receptor [Flavisolibacter sp.]